MVCLGFELGAGGRKVQTNPLSYGSPHNANIGRVLHKLVHVKGKLGHCDLKDVLGSC